MSCNCHCPEVLLFAGFFSPIWMKERMKEWRNERMNEWMKFTGRTKVAVSWIWPVCWIPYTRKRGWGQRHSQKTGDWYNSPSKQGWSLNEGYGSRKLQARDTESHSRSKTSKVGWMKEWGTRERTFQESLLCLSNWVDRSPISWNRGDVGRAGLGSKSHVASVVTDRRQRNRVPGACQVKYRVSG